MGRYMPGLSLDCDWSLHVQVCLYVTTNHNLETNLACNDQSQSRDNRVHVATNYYLKTSLDCDGLLHAKFVSRL
jgi:hypothetical protein